MEIERDKKGGKVSVMKKRYLNKVLQKFNINVDTKSISTSLALHFKLKATMFPTFVEEHEYMTQVPYASVVSSLIYAMVCTMSDLHKLSQWLADTCTISVGVIRWQ